jgi:hypothetical protein
MPTKLKRILVFFRLVDDYDSNLSLTHIGVIIVLVKLALVQHASIVDLGSLLVALANLNMKKYINAANNVQNIADNIKSKIES